MFYGSTMSLGGFNAPVDNVLSPEESSMVPFPLQIFIASM